MQTVAIVVLIKMIVKPHMYHVKRDPNVNTLGRIEKMVRHAAYRRRTIWERKERKTNTITVKNISNKKQHPVLKPIINKGSNKVPIQVLQKKLIRKLNRMDILMDVNHVVIENQPSLKNPRMKAIASTLYDFFLMRSTVDKEIFNCNIEKVCYMSPSKQTESRRKKYYQSFIPRGK